MDKILELVSKLLPFEKWGLKREIAEPVSLIVLIMLVFLFGLLGKLILKRYKNWKASINEIIPHFDYKSIDKAKKYYIPTQYQNASPAREEEPGFTHKYISRSRLIPFFIKTAFNQKLETEKFYLILADSGMGKTTFMINLYLSYNSFFSRHKKKNMKLFRFSSPDIINDIKSISISDARSTILLLDALDEDRGIVSQDLKVSDAEAFNKRVDEIIELTRNFSEIIITCRTQYFPGQEDDPYELKVKRPDEKGFYVLNKLYISPFNDKEVKRYLDKKYGIFLFNRKRKQRALNIVNQSKKLIMRPMLLSYIDYLIDDDQVYNSTYSLYDNLVVKWLNREAEKRKGINEREKFIENLKNLSQRIAVQLYLNWKQDGRLFLSKEESVDVAKNYSIELKAEEITGQSLLTCDGLGNWKFAHKSIMEFFLAKETYENPRFLKHMNFVGMDMAKKFYYELERTFIHADSEYISSWSTNTNLMPFYFQALPIIEIKSRAKTKEVVDYGGGFVLADAIKYCNKQNQKNGYPNVYDDSGHFLDSKGNIVHDIKHVSGFRLPTVDELRCIYFNRKEYTVSLMEIKRKYDSDVFVKMMKTILDKEMVIEFSGVGEWAFDFTGESVVKYKIENMDIISSKNVQQNLQELTMIQILNSKDVEELSNKKYTFRIVYVP